MAGREVLRSEERSDRERRDPVDSPQPAVRGLRSGDRSVRGSVSGPALRPGRQEQISSLRTTSTISSRTPTSCATGSGAGRSIRLSGWTISIPCYARWGCLRNSSRSVRPRSCAFPWPRTPSSRLNSERAFRGGSARAASAGRERGSGVRLLRIDPSPVQIGGIKRIEVLVRREEVGSGGDGSGSDPHVILFDGLARTAKKEINLSVQVKDLVREVDNYQILKEIFQGSSLCRAPAQFPGEGQRFPDRDDGDKRLFRSRP